MQSTITHIKSPLKAVTQLGMFCTPQEKHHLKSLLQDFNFSTLLDLDDIATTPYIQAYATYAIITTSFHKGVGDILLEDVQEAFLQFQELETELLDKLEKLHKLAIFGLPKVRHYKEKRMEQLLNKEFKGLRQEKLLSGVTDISLNDTVVEVKAVSVNCNAVGQLLRYMKEKKFNKGLLVGSSIKPDAKLLIETLREAGYVISFRHMLPD